MDRDALIADPLDPMEVRFSVEGQTSLQMELAARVVLEKFFADPTDGWACRYHIAVRSGPSRAADGVPVLWFGDVTARMVRLAELG